MVNEQLTELVVVEKLNDEVSVLLSKSIEESINLIEENKNNMAETDNEVLIVGVQQNQPESIATITPYHAAWSVGKALLISSNSSNCNITTTDESSDNNSTLNSTLLYLGIGGVVLAQSV